MATIRHPAVAGAFYPQDPRRLGETVAALLPSGVERSPAAGVMAPHAGYVYSGAAAGRTFASVAVPSRVILLGPNHTGRGVAFAAAPEDEWLTPLGKVAVDRVLLSALVEAGAGVAFDGRAHQAEHALEVEVPFLQTLRPGLSIAPVVVGTHDLAALLELGEALAEVIAASPEKPLVVISSDMTHYEPAKTAAAKDRDALDALAAVDPERLHTVVRHREISMCGVAPAVAALAAFRRLGVRRGELVVYTHSGVVTGDDREVVAYAGMVFRA